MYHQPVDAVLYVVGQLSHISLAQILSCLSSCSGGISEIFSMAPCMLSSSTWRNMIPLFTLFCNLYPLTSRSVSMGRRCGSAPVTTSMMDLCEYGPRARSKLRLLYIKAAAPPHLSSSILSQKKVPCCCLRQSVQLINKKYMKRQRETINSKSKWLGDKKKTPCCCLRHDFFS